MNDTNIPFTEYDASVSFEKNLKLFEKPLPVTIIRLLGNTTAPNTDVPNTDELEPNTAALLKLPTLTAVSYTHLTLPTNREV